MAEYEALLGNEHFQSQHVEGATTLSFVAASRFAIAPAVPKSEAQNTRDPETSSEYKQTGSDHSGESRSAITAESPRN